ncbi:Pvc16 family protein [Streptomyces luomodiensis]|uniref:Pvc16 family protein n=1 Tax=Streptomyces luomodiensis TaxID=3026192 RepID=A0ABY9URQ0_9ACTN|nr:Pvc16 family protein [Streptomyces sp. SCA4-21]WNE94946.1 Pvc16 family protein [Streptomyces sp. SCA4-21]
MSNGLAFATVTQALALLIANNLRPEIDIAVTVDTHRPPAEPPTEPTINIFLYQVTPNASMRATDLPTRASDGTLLKRPAAAMDLHYLISAYGEESELVGQRLIGAVVRILHEIPMLPKDVIEEAARRSYLAGSDLAESVQRVRFTPTQMDVDETSKLWGMLYQTPYVLSVCYQGSLVLIEGREQPVPAKPVERHTVRAVPFGAPGAPEPPASPGPHEPSAESAPVEAEAEAKTAPETEPPAPAKPTKKRAAAAKTAAAKTAAAPTRPRKTTARRRGGRSGDPES